MSRRFRKIPAHVLCVFGLVVFVALSSWAQTTLTRQPAFTTTLQGVKAFAHKLAPQQTKMLSGSAQNLIRIAENADTIAAMSPHLFPTSPATLSSDAATSTDPVAVSNPSNDFAFSVQTGFTQSETSTAWCGDNVVVGFNDTGSILESIAATGGGVSVNGLALSQNKGASFADLGFLNPGNNLLAGDPVLGCASPTTFYYASLFETTSSSGIPFSAVSVSKSSDGGSTFGHPVVAVQKNGFVHLLDKDWMAIDPTDTNRIYVTYTDFDSSGVCGFLGPGEPILRIAIELVRSTNGGASWSGPKVLTQFCSFPPFPFVQGSQVAVGPSGEVYVAWELFAGGLFSPRQILIRKSTNNGLSFAPAVKIDDVSCIGDCFTVQGLFRTAIDLGGLVVDRSGTATEGNVYVVWHDGRNLTVPSFTATGTYGYGDVLISRSRNGGATWSSAVRVNNNLEPLPSGRGTDQYQPGVAVDSGGRVAVCWYDRRLDPLNFKVDRFCGLSTNAGATWTNTRQTLSSWLPIHATDFIVDPLYMGDYDGVASDFTKTNLGFVNAFQVMRSTGVFVPNPDVKATSF